MHGPDFRLELGKVTSGYDGHACWVHARAGALPGGSEGGPPTVLLTTQKLLLSGSDVFYALHSTRSTDLGATWSPLVEQKSFDRITIDGGYQKTVCDFTPKWHAASRTLLGTGQTVHYADDSHPVRIARETAYAVYDAVADRWGAWATLAMPDPGRFAKAGAGSAQRFDLEDGDILLPVYFDIADGPRRCASTVFRCRFDGASLVCTEQGNALSVPEPRGLTEPSLTRFAGRFFLTLRNDARGYVAVGDDGLHFGEPRPWTFDDGTDLGNYNTQQHWVTHTDGLFLVYTRRGLKNDHVFRHRAPLMIAQVDPERLCVLRETERVLVPERGARLGNFGVANVTESETWVTVTEWMQPDGCEKYGSDNTLWIARILWDRPNAGPRQDLSGDAHARRPI